MLDFPANPQVGDAWLGSNGFTYIWDGEKWRIVSVPGGGGQPINTVSGRSALADPTAWTIDGVNRAFLLVSGGVRLMPVNASDCIVILDGVTQQPITDYATNADVLTFVIAPRADGALFIIVNLLDDPAAGGTFLPITGGTMTGDIVFSPTQTIEGGMF